MKVTVESGIKYQGTDNSYQSITVPVAAPEKMTKA